MNDIWLKNDRIRLRAPEPEDLDLMYAMENDTSLWSIGNTKLPYSRYTLRNYIEQTRHDLYAERQARFVIETIDGTAIGMIDLADYSPADARAEVCIGILSRHQGQGLAHEALTLLCDYSFGPLGMHQLYAYIPVEHEKSKNLFEKVGFSESAVLKEWKRNEDDFMDISLYQLLKSDRKS